MLVVVTVAVIVGAFALGMFQLSGESTGEPAVGSGWISFVSDRDGDAEIYVMNADGSDVIQLTDDDADDGFPAWSPDGSRIAFTSRGDIYVMNVDGGGVVQLTGNSSKSCESVFFSDRDGDGSSELYVRHADGSIELFTDYDSLNWRSADWYPSWSPDGGRIAFQSYRDGDADIYVMDANGSGVVQLTENDKLDWFPSWSPDGEHIAFASERDGDHAEIYVMKADGTGIERLTDDEQSNIQPVWSPDGGRIAFVSGRDGKAGIFVMNADGSGVERFEEGHSPAWSPLLE